MFAFVSIPLSNYQNMLRRFDVNAITTQPHFLKIIHPGCHENLLLFVVLFSTEVQTNTDTALGFFLALLSFSHLIFQH